MKSGGGGAAKKLLELVRGQFHPWDLAQFPAHPRNCQIRLPVWMCPWSTFASQNGEHSAFFRACDSYQAMFCSRENLTHYLPLCLSCHVTLQVLTEHSRGVMHYYLTPVTEYCASLGGAGKIQARSNPLCTIPTLSMTPLVS